MFTGIVQAVGEVAQLERMAGDVRLAIAAPASLLERSAVGDSIAVAGCCLTVTRMEGRLFYADVSRETLALTTLNAWQPGTRVNLEPALRAGDPLGGHYVTGHVDGVATLDELTDDARSRRVMLAAPAGLGRYLARKGSVTLDGVSLTVNDVGPDERFSVNLVPHTLTVTTLQGWAPGSSINLEIDVIARYVERLR